MDSLFDISLGKLLHMLFVHFKLGPERMTLTISKEENNKLLDILKNNKEARTIFTRELENCIVSLSSIKYSEKHENETVLFVLSRIDEARRQILTLNKIPSEELSSEEYVTITHKYTNILGNLRNSSFFDKLTEVDPFGTFSNIETNMGKIIESLLGSKGICDKLQTELGITFDEELLCVFITKEHINMFITICKPKNQLNFSVKEIEITISEYESNSIPFFRIVSVLWKKGNVSSEFYILSHENLTPKKIVNIIKKKTSDLEEYAKYF
jgi:hypothetical protein